MVSLNVTLALYEKPQPRLKRFNVRKVHQTNTIHDKSEMQCVHKI